eukprot:scaffold15222_cov89-Skeletonema_dohrnii-CCMP3373.AAC.1
MFYLVVLADDNEESVATVTPPCVFPPARIWIWVLDLTKMLQLLRPVELVMPCIARRLSLSLSRSGTPSAYFFATSSSTPASRNNREGRGNRRRNSDRRCHFAKFSLGARERSHFPPSR